MEETEGTESPTVESQYAYGRGIDDVLVLFDKDGESYDAYYYLKDPLWTVEALVDENAAIVEAYAYEVYGERGLLIVPFPVKATETLLARVRR